MSQIAISRREADERDVVGGAQRVVRPGRHLLAGVVGGGDQAVGTGREQRILLPLTKRAAAVARSVLAPGARSPARRRVADLRPT